MNFNDDGVVLTLKNPATGVEEDKMFPIGSTFTVDAEQIPDDNIGGVSDTTFPRAVVGGEEISLSGEIVPGKRYRVACAKDEGGDVTAVYLDEDDEEDVE